MSSTNKTTNYELSQFIGADKPAWLTDYNTDMGKIDTGIHTAQSTATGADGKADANATAIGTLSGLSTDVKTDLVSAINEVDGHADTAQNSASSANSTAISALNKATGLENALKLTTNLTYDKDSATITGGTISTGEIYIARNSTGSVFKVYNANMAITPNGGSGTIVITLPTTGIATDNAYTIVGGGLAQTVNYSIGGVTITVNNGNIQVSFSVRGNETHYLRLFACLYFNSDFGDEPEE